MKSLLCQTESHAGTPCGGTSPERFKVSQGSQRCELWQLLLSLSLLVSSVASIWCVLIKECLGGLHIYILSM